MFLTTFSCRILDKLLNRGFSSKLSVRDAAAAVVGRSDARGYCNTWTPRYPAGGAANARVVDLRSDAVAKPRPEIRRAMAEAEVGDDGLGEDPIVTGGEAFLF